MIDERQIFPVERRTLAQINRDNTQKHGLQMQTRDAPREIYALIERMVGKGGDTDRDIAEEVAERFNLTIPAAMRYIEEWRRQDAL